MSYEFIDYCVTGPLGLITLNRPDKLNAVSLGMLDELHAAVDTALLDDRVRESVSPVLVKKPLPPVRTWAKWWIVT